MSDTISNVLSLLPAYSVSSEPSASGPAARPAACFLCSESWTSIILWNVQQDSLFCKTPSSRCFVTVIEKLLRKEVMSQKQTGLLLFSVTQNHKISVGCPSNWIWGHLKDAACVVCERFPQRILRVEISPSVGGGTFCSWADIKRV